MNMKNMIATYERDGFQFVAEGTTTLDSVVYKTLFFQSPTQGRIIVLVSDDDSLYQEYRATGNHGKVA